MMQTLTPDMTVPLDYEINPRCAMNAHGVCGPAGIARAVKELFEGKTVRLASCVRKECAGPYLIREIFTLAPFPGAKCIRYCGEDGDPDGNGSHTMIGFCHEKGKVSDLDPAEVAAIIAMNTGSLVFRLRD